MLQLFAYLSIAILLITAIVRVVKILRAPLNLRWELYPVAHEKTRASYGGSYFEEFEWWTKPQGKSLVKQYLAMASEIFFLKGVYEYNRGLWVWSFPFHVGLYLTVGFLGLLLGGAVIQTAGIPITPDGSWIIKLIYWLTVVCGLAGSLIGLYGATGLFFKRLADKKFRMFNTPAVYFNILFVFAIFLTGLLTWIDYDQGYDFFRRFFQDLITVNVHPVNNGFAVAQIVCIFGFFIYFPFTNMVHMFMKYFTWDKIRWDDTPNFKGSEIEKRIMSSLSYGVSWSAPHIQKDKTWGEVATEIPEELD